MPLVPGGARYGLGLWNFPAATLAVELALFGAGVTVYLSAFKLKDRAAPIRALVAADSAFLLYLGSVLRAASAGHAVLALSALAIWLTVPWAAWADRSSQARESGTGRIELIAA